MSHAPGGQFADPVDAMIVGPITVGAVEIKDEVTTDEARVLPDGTVLAALDANGLLIGIYDGAALRVARGTASGSAFSTLQNPAGTNITSTTIGGDEGLDVHVVGSISPGGAAANLGKIADAIYSGVGELGVMSLAVRNDALTTLAGDGDYIPLMVNAAGELVVTVGGGSGTSAVDDSAFAVGVDSVTPAGALFDDVAPDSVNEGDVGLVRMSGNRNLYGTIRDAAGNERGVNVTAANQAEVSVTAALPAGTNNIGDVDVLSVVPGAGATNLGKAEDAVHGSGDVGVMALAVRNDALGPLAADGDYIPLMVNAAGELVVTVGGGSGTSAVDDSAFTVGVDSVTPAGALFDDAAPDSVDEGDVGLVRMSANRNLYGTIRDAAGNERGVNVTAANQAEVAVTAALPAGTNNIGDVDVVSSALPTGASTSALQTTGNAILTTIDTDTGTIAGAVSGSEMQVDIVAALPAGTNNIGDVDVLSVVPGTGATNLGKAEDAVHGSGDVGVMALAVRSDADSPFAADGDYTPLATDASGFLKVSIESAGSGGTSAVDDSAFTVGTDRVTPAGALFDDAAPDSVDEGDVGLVRMSANRNQYGTIRDAAGNERGVNVTAANQAEVAVTAALPAGTNNIGDVDVLSVVPGVGATNLGKAEDAVAGSGDVGVMALAVRRDADGANAADGDYAELQVNDDGKLKVAAEVSGSTITWAAPTSATVGVASASALAANASRKGAIFTNDSTAIIYLGIGAAAVVGSGIRINANGGTYEINATNLSTQVINAIATAAASNLCVHEAT